MPPTNGWSRVHVTSFHPMCGTFTPAEGSLRIVPCNNPSPASGSSSLPSNRICSPRQTPSTGLPPRANSAITRSRPRSRRPRMHAPNAPTPGTTSASDCSAAPGSSTSLGRPPADVERHFDERLVHRGHAQAVAADARLVAERFRERLAQRDPDVLHRVVRVDLEIALRRHLEVEARVHPELLQHVVEERQARMGGRGAGAVDRQRDPHTRLLRGALHLRTAAHDVTSSSASRNRSVSSGVPALTRKHPGTAALMSRTS